MFAMSTPEKLKIYQPKQRWLWVYFATDLCTVYIHTVCVWGVDVEVVLIGCGSAVGAWLTLGLRPYFSILSTEEQEQEHPWFITND